MQRLPVNPRRHKVAPDQRKRVATACNNCNVRRIKCSGERPCRQCSTASRECQYPTTIEKVSISRPELESLRLRCAVLEQALQEAVPDESRRQALLSLAPNPSTTASTQAEAGGLSQHYSPAPSSRGDGASTAAAAPAEEDAASTEGRLLQDFDGTPRYLGETSGATFLDVLKRFMATTVPLAFHGRGEEGGAGGLPQSNLRHDSDASDGNTFIASVGRYQTHDSRPVFLPQVDPFSLPSRTDMTVMLARSRFYIQDGSGDFPSGGIYYWGDMGTVPSEARSPGVSVSSGGAGDAASPGSMPMYSGVGVGISLSMSMGMGAEPSNSRYLAFYHTAFAFDSLLRLKGGGSKPEGRLDENDTYFARARLLLGSPLDTTMYTANDTGVLALMGLYMVQNNRRDAAYIYTSTAMHIAIMHGLHRGYAQTEAARRTFWTVYILDRWLSCLMGRPPSIPDDAIRLDLPADQEGLPPAMGLRAHIELARISDYIVDNIYHVVGALHRRQQSDKAGIPHIDRAMQLLADWKAKLPSQLQAHEDTWTSDRAYYVLHMTYNQLLILAIRPVFFLAVKKSVAERFVKRAWAIEDHPHIIAIRECSDAARRNLRLGRQLRDHASPINGKLLHGDLHHIFNAAIVLMLHQIVFVNLRTNDVIDVDFAIETFEREAATGSHFGLDCAKVLRDLSALVKALRSMMFEIQVPVVEPGPGEQIFASLTGGASVPATYGTGSVPMKVNGPEPGMGNNMLPVTGATTPMIPQRGAGDVPMTAGLAQFQMLGQNNEAVFQELLAWMQEGNELQLYPNSFMA